MLKKRAFFIRLDVPEVEPDTYAFCPDAEDSASGVSSQIAINFIIQQEKTKKREK